MTRSMESILQLLGSLQSEVNSVPNAHHIDNAKIIKLQETSAALTSHYILHTTVSRNKNVHSCPFFLSRSKPREKLPKYKKESSLVLFSFKEINSGIH